jgi:phosphatidylethanolamine-binding protein (PEBP) family uncharacterized protein
MKIIGFISITFFICLPLQAHDLSVPGKQHPHAQNQAPQPTAVTGAVPRQAASFALFSPAVKTRWDEKFLFIESNGLPAHNMMVGITAWQQQVPLPQNYTGANAWRLPLVPVPAEEPATIRDRFLRGAIAIAANGIPIFNPQNNRGEISLDIGELDEWGGHCGRADDYHYHIAPLHLQKVTGTKLPIAHALDGYPVYGLAEPDGSIPKSLDALNGHSTPDLGYHYHASKTYPFVMGGFHGQVTERDGQVDPQPRATPVREALQALRGAKITGFEKQGASNYKLTYTMDGETRSVAYTILPDGTCQFQFDHGSKGVTTETYRPREGGGGKDGPPRDRKPMREPRPRDGTNAAPRIEPPDPPRSSNGRFLLTSPVVDDMAELPKEFTGDDEGISPPLAWKEAPAGTVGYALIMDHVDAKGGRKWYWTLYDIPASVTSLKQGARDVGKLGTGFRGGIGYEPPMSKGPGARTYVITLYALSAPLAPARPDAVDRESLLAAIKGKVLASSSLRVVHTSRGHDGNAAAESPTRRQIPITNPQAPAGKGGPPGLVKPAISDTMKLNVYADNWFMLYVNGRLVAVDPIEFTPHNVVSVDFLPEYPMTIAVLAKNNADPGTGMEYGTSIGDGGFILKFGDGTVTNATWKAKCFSHGPVNRDTKNPQVRTEPLPDKWWEPDFDDSRWPHAKEYTVKEVAPKQPYFENDFKDARFIWASDLALDNTVIFRTRIDKAGWTPRWNTRPDLNVKGVDAGASGH